ncbi:HD domain-containing protein [Fodinibius sediminis]|uniref:5'-deoxynucleotidase n=1 Tax=Fodinibius sediminis TaxID=1214077 RepID=A0A521EKA6_9BACT|nr:HD domain-containing protein [Fodinibius sediminis]SMO84348.1 putative hydrolases of HD superfamily [Fodinibius sediminis]
MEKEELKGILTFLRNSEQLKNTYRSSYTSTGRTESVAEHSWRLCLMALILERYFPEVDMARVIKICIVHDLGEAINGDIPAPAQDNSTDKSENERSDLLQLADSLPSDLKEALVELWDEYETVTSAEARTAKAFDKMETIIQHNQGKNPEDFDYAFNLHYGREYTSDHPIISSMRKMLDEETGKRANNSDN